MAPRHTLALLLLVGCSRAPDVKLQYSTVRDGIDLGATSYERAPPTQSWSVLNTGAATIMVSVIRFEGDGAPWLTTAFPDFTVVSPTDSATVDVTLANDPATWDHGSYSADMIVELGTLWDDPRDFDDVGQWKPELISVPVTFTLLCDLDEDGREAPECTGLDCDDGNAKVHPGARERCNGFDDDCDGRTNEGGVCDVVITPTDTDTGATATGPSDTDPTDTDPTDTDPTDTDTDTDPTDTDPTDTDPTDTDPTDTDPTDTDTSAATDTDTDTSPATDTDTDTSPATDTDTP